MSLGRLLEIKAECREKAVLCLFAGVLAALFVSFLSCAKVETPRPREYDSAEKEAAKYLRAIRHAQGKFAHANSCYADFKALANEMLLNADFLTEDGISGDYKFSIEIQESGTYFECFAEPLNDKHRPLKVNPVGEYVYDFLDDGCGKWFRID